MIFKIIRTQQYRNSIHYKRRRFKKIKVCGSVAMVGLGMVSEGWNGVDTELIQ